MRKGFGTILLGAVLLRIAVELPSLNRVGVSLKSRP